MYWRRRTITRIWILLLGGTVLLAEWLGSIGPQFSPLPSAKQSSRIQRSAQSALEHDFPEFQQFHQAPDWLGLNGTQRAQQPDWLGLDDSLLHQEPYWSGSWIPAGGDPGLDLDALVPEDRIGNIGPPEAEDAAAGSPSTPPQSQASPIPSDW